MRAQATTQSGVNAATHPLPHGELANKPKKKACVFFATRQGCRNGNACPFPHHSSSNTNATNPDGNSDTTKQGIEGTVTQLPPWIDEDTGQTKACKFFVSVKGCRAGEQCQFRHDKNSHSTPIVLHQQLRDKTGNTSSSATAFGKETKPEAKLTEPNQKENNQRNNSTTTCSTAGTGGTSSTSIISYADVVKESSSRSTTTQTKKGRSLARGRMVPLATQPPPLSATNAMPQQQQSEQTPRPQLRDCNSSSTRDDNNSKTNDTILAKAYGLQRNSTNTKTPQIKNEDYSISAATTNDKKNSVEVQEERKDYIQPAMTPSPKPTSWLTSSRKVQLFIDTTTTTVTPTTSNVAAGAVTANDCKDEYDDYGRKVVCEPQAPRSHPGLGPHHHYGDDDDDNHGRHPRSGTLEDRIDSMRNKSPENHGLSNPKTSGEEKFTSIYDTAVTTPGFSLELFEANECAGAGWSSVDLDGSDEEEDDDDATRREENSMVSDVTLRSDNESSIGTSNSDSSTKELPPTVIESEVAFLYSQDWAEHEKDEMLSSPPWSNGGHEQHACAAVLANMKDAVGRTVARPASQEYVALTQQQLLSPTTRWEPTTSATFLPIDSTSISPTTTETSSLFVQAWTFPYGEDQEVELWEQLENSGTVNYEILEDDDDDDVDGHDNDENLISGGQNINTSGPTAGATSFTDDLPNVNGTSCKSVSTRQTILDKQRHQTLLSVVVSFDADESQTTKQTGNTRGPSTLELPVGDCLAAGMPRNSDADWDPAIGTLPSSPSEFASPVGKIVATIQGEGNHDDDESTLSQMDWCRDVEQPTSPGSIYSRDRDDREALFTIAIKMKNRGDAAFAEEQYPNAVLQYKKVDILLDELLPAAYEYVHVSDYDFVRKAKAEKFQILDKAAVCHLRRQKWRSAATSAIRALEIDQQNESARYHLALAFFGMKNYVDCIDNAIRVRGEEASALVSQALQILRSLTDQYESLFRLIIDSYRLREVDEHLVLRQKGSDSNHELHEMHPSQRDSGAIPLHHFRAYISMGVRQGIIPRFVVEDDEAMQALLFMAHTDGFSNLAYPLTAPSIGAFYGERADCKETLDSLRKFALDIKGPIQQVEELLSTRDCCILEEDTPSWQPTAWRYSCSHLLA